MTHTIRTQDEDIILDPGSGSIRLKGGIFINDVPLIQAGTEFGAVSDALARTGTGSNQGGSAVITFAPGTIMNAFVVGTDVKVFGANTTALAPSTPTAPTATYTGITGGLNLSYKVAVMDMITGQISAASGASNTNTVISNVPAASVWTETNRASVTASRSNTNQAILVYRALKAGALVNADYVLTYVWGPQQLGNALTVTVQDFGTYDLTTWSEAQFSADNQYLNTVVHVPHVAPASALKGWHVATITDVDVLNTRITLDTALTFNTPASVTVYVDNTRVFQQAVNDAAAAGVNTLQVTGGEYLLGAIQLPNGMTIVGNNGSTRIIKQYWDTHAWSTPATQPYTGSLFYAKSITDLIPTASSGITIKDMNLDGNKVHQIPFGNSQGLIHLPGLSTLARASQNSVSSMKVRNSDVPVINAEYNDKFSLRDSVISEGPRTYQYFTSPIQLGNSTKSMVLDNQFEQWPGPVDVSANKKTVVDGNLVTNCGTGLRIYATSQSLTSNNYVLGPADEWIPTPDLKDSDFNSVNVTVARGITFAGPELLYVQDGEPVDLSTVTVRGRVYQLNGPPGTEYYGAEYEKSVGGDLIDIQSTLAQLQAGVVRFGITAPSTQQLPVGQMVKGAYAVSGLSWNNSTKQLTVTVGANASQFVLGNSLRLQFNTTTPDINNQDWPIVAVNATTVVVQLPASTPVLTTANDGSAFATAGATLGYQITGETYDAAQITGGTGGNITAYATLLTANVVNPGTDYVPGQDTLKLTATPQGTNDASLLVTHTRLVAVTIANAGSGLTPGETTFTVAGGTAVTAATFTATVSAGGVVTAINSITQSGSYTANPSLTGNVATVNGNPTTATFNLKMGANLITVSAGGAYTLSDMTNLTTATTNMGATGTGATVTCTGGLANVFTIGVPGGAFYHVAPRLVITPSNGEGTNATATCTVNATGQITTVTRGVTGTGYTATPIVSIEPYGGYYYTDSGDHFFVVSVSESTYNALPETTDVQLRGLVLTNPAYPNNLIQNQDLQVISRNQALRTVTLQLPPPPPLAPAYDGALKSTVSGTIDKKTNFIIARGLVGVI